MYLLYVDESGDTGPQGSSHLVLAGAALFEGKWRWIKRDLEALLTRYFPATATRPRELHCAEARKGRGPYAQLTQGQRDALLADACALLDNLKEKELALFTVVTDKAWWYARNPGKTGDDLYLAAFEDLISRFDYYLKRRHHEGESAKGLIIADPRHQAFCAALRQAVLQFHLVGTQWARLENVIESVLFLPSHESPGVQLADLTAYAIWRAVQAGDVTLASRLKHCFDREPGGGKWHGLRYHGPATTPARTTLRGVRPGL